MRLVPPRFATGRRRRGARRGAGVLRLLLPALVLLPAAGAAADAPPLSARALANLTACTRLLGYVRYFHPSDEAAAADWDAFAIAAMDTVERAATPERLAATLRRLFLPLAPTLSVETGPTGVEPSAFAVPGARVVAFTAWTHHGCGRGAEPQPDFFWSERTRRPVAGGGGSAPAGDAILHAPLGGGVWCTLPMELPCDSAGTLPRASLPAWEPARAATARRSGDDRATRLAGVALFWNAAQHFYPYFDVTDTDWPAALRIALQEAAADRDAHEFESTLRRLVARLRDGHGGVSSRDTAVGVLPLAWAWIEDRLVVTAAEERLAPGVRPGDAVAAIDGVPVAARLAEVEPLVSHATPQHLRHRSCGWLMRGAGGDSVTLELRSPVGERRLVRLGRLRGAVVVEDRPEKIARLRPGVWYVDLDRVADADLDPLLDTLAAARGIVFDLRGFPRQVSPDLLAHLADTTLSSLRCGTPVVRRPDRREVVFETSHWDLTPRPPRFRGRAAFLMDGRAISRAETYLALVEHHRLGALVGEATAGTDGEVVTVPLPGGYRARFTGMRALKNDGARLHGVGILPTVPVARTIAGVAAGRDEVLERALEIVDR